MAMSVKKNPTSWNLASVPSMLEESVLKNPTIQVAIKYLGSIMDLGPKFYTPNQEVLKTALRLVEEDIKKHTGQDQISGYQFLSRIGEMYGGMYLSEKVEGYRGEISEIEDEIRIIEDGKNYPREGYPLDVC